MPTVLVLANNSLFEREPRAIILASTDVYKNSRLRQESLSYVALFTKEQKGRSIGDYTMCAKSYNRVTAAETVFDLISSRKERKIPLIAVVAGSGLVTKSAAQAGVDMIIVLNAGLYRHFGLGSMAAYLPYGNANEQTETLIRMQVKKNSRGRPIIAGCHALDPIVKPEHYLQRLRAIGVAGITNWPAFGLIDGTFKSALEEAGWGTQEEINVLNQARDAGFATFAFAFDPEAAAAFAASGVDGIIMNVGLTREVEDLVEKNTLVEIARSKARRMYDAIQETGTDPLCVVFGGPVTNPDDIEKIFRHVPVHGFAGGSVFERIPVSGIIGSTIKRFRSVPLREKPEELVPRFGPMVGESPAMQDLFQKVAKVSAYDISVCVEGESGTGKELVASHIHELSSRRTYPLVSVNCGAIPETLVEAEFFGHEKGSFTGAHQRKLGKFELANNGTLFLDEVSELSPHAQQSLLRVIQEREVTRIGGEIPIPLDVRIVAASNKPLKQLVHHGEFREDLFYRISTITITVPPLRERSQDIPALVSHFLNLNSIKLNKPLFGVSEEFMEKLLRHHWPGNVRELDHSLARAAVLEENEILTGRDFVPHQMNETELHEADTQFNPSTPFRTPTEAPFLDLREMEKAKKHSRQLQIQRALLNNGGNKTMAARELGISRKTLYEWIRDYSTL